MIHPVFRLAAAQPLWLAEHAAAYASLVSEALQQGGERLQQRLVLQLAGAACLVVAFTLLGVAVLLWASFPDAGTRSPWLFWLTPVVPAALGVWALRAAQGRAPEEVFERLRGQLDQDLAMLRTPTAP
ncbi:hypothetical protein ACVC7V_07005 [Hydrogenophaga sp. A37]|uniref:hypothetical protein n=1 Tax=Hydrogenophaga sp. A37 TaxID=1945864 RepID=UPI0009876A96|nr:hypothetical protein [Hydrogenophaga sp. A37]OOG80470.1 hypothetical protein B0E41_20700 [Hydrogenophaga sp. A37]